MLSARRVKFCPHWRWSRIRQKVDLRVDGVKVADEVASVDADMPVPASWIQTAITRNRSGFLSSSLSIIISLFHLLDFLCLFAHL